MKIGSLPVLLLGWQLLAVRYKYSVGHKVFEKNIEGLRKALSFEYLRSLLAK